MFEKKPINQEEKEQTHPFYMVLIFAFYIDGFISEKEKERLSNFLRFFSKYSEDEQAFQKILSMRPPTKEEVIGYLKSIDDASMRFYYLLQVLALVSDEGVAEEEAVFMEIASKVGVGEKALGILQTIFINEDFDNKNILFIGNEKTLDIVKSETEHTAYFFELYGNYYFLAEKNSGLININNMAMLDDIVFKFGENDGLFIGNSRFTIEDLRFRLSLKQKNTLATFFIIKEKDEEKANYYIAPADSPYSVARIHLNGTSVKILKETNALVSFSVKDEIIEKYEGSIDISLTVDDAFMFDIASEIPNLLLARKVTSKIVDKTEISAGNSTDFDIFIPIDEKEGINKIIFKRSAAGWCVEPKDCGVTIHIGSERVTKQTAVKSGSIVEIQKRFMILFDPDNENIKLIQNKIFSVTADNLVVRYGNKIALNHLSFENHNRDFVCVMGPSGCGKSTLIRTLSGYQRPQDVKTLRINSHAYYPNFDIFGKHIGYVPQDDLLFENLTVYENLFYYGKLKCPEAGEGELSKKIDLTLRDLRLSEMKDRLVGSPEKRILSGGERRRLNIGLELLSDCDVLILDEPTSGLSSFDTHKIIELLSDIAKQGKIIYVVIHQPSPAVFSMFSHLLLLDRGGYLAYFGKTAKAYEYFAKYSLTGSRRVVSPDDILDILEAVRRTPDGEIIYESDGKVNIPMRVKTPEQWRDEYLMRKGDIDKEGDRTRKEGNLLPASENAPIIISAPMRFSSLFMRNLKNRFRDRGSTLLSVFIPLLLSSFLSFVLRYKEGSAEYTYAANANIPKFLFLTGIIFIFLSISNSVSEILKDRLFLEKEKVIGYSGFSYLLSKLFTLGITNFYQVLIYITVSFIILDIPIVIIHNGIFYVGFFITVFAFSFIASISVTVLGLLISSFLRSEKAAFLAVPLIIIPQIIFGGMFLNFNELKSLNLVNPNRAVPFICDLTHSRWMYEGYLNIFRYKHPGKHKGFKKSKSFEEKYGDFENRKIKSLFLTYNQSEAENEEVKKEENQIREERLSEFFALIREAEWRRLSFTQYVKACFTKGINFFPYYKKLVYPIYRPFLIRTSTYDTWVLIIYAIVAFIITAVKLNSDKKK